MVQLVATEEEWMRIIRLWHPEFEITYRDCEGRGVVSSMNLWAVGETKRVHDSLGTAFAYAFKHAEDSAWHMCKLVENERTQDK